MNTPMPAAPATARTLVLTDWGAMDGTARDRWLAGLRPPEPGSEVADIIEAVRRRGDAALRELTERLDGVRLDDLWASDAEFAAAGAAVPTEVMEALAASAAAVRRFHADQRDALRPRRVVRTLPGVTAWRRFVPLGRVAGYAPGGRAPLVSTVIMLAVPARLAGVDELILATPPSADGSVAAPILVAARLVGVDRVLKVGGAHAIAALAYGTESVPRVDLVAGAGGAWVTAAKRAVAGDVRIDLPAGPSECIILADASADPALVALDLLAQAEHGPDSVSILLTDAPGLADAVEEQLPASATGLATGASALETLHQWGRTVLVPTLDAGLEVIEAIAPEHVSLQCAGAADLAERVRHAGSVFIGPSTPVAGGDYASGSNHVLPTGGAARAWGGIGVETFGRWIVVQEASVAGVRRMAPTVAALAQAEGLPAHAASVLARAERDDEATADDPVALLRRPEHTSPYPAEPSDEELAASTGRAPEEIVRADLNTLGGGALPGAAAGLRDYPADAAVEYGDMAYARLRRALGGLLGVEPSRVMPGAGADELIRLVTTMSIGAGDAVIVPTPTFAMFAVEARLAGARVVEVPRREPDTRQSADELRAAAEEHSARLVWLCNPNNPTGDAYPLDEIGRLARDLQALVVVDEVYAEFAAAEMGVSPRDLSAVGLQGELPNLLVLRSLAKSHGLAGARVGYLVVPAALAERFDGARLPLSLAGPSQAMALGALAEQATADERIAEMVAQRRRLAEWLVARGCRVLASVTNFVTFRPAAITGADLAAKLLGRGIAVRAYDGGVLAGWLRITARDVPQTDRILDALGEVL